MAREKARDMTKVLTPAGLQSRFNELVNSGIKTEEASTIFKYDSKFKLLENGDFEMKYYFDSIENKINGYEFAEEVHISALENELKKSRNSFINSLDSDSELAETIKKVHDAQSNNQGRVPSTNYGIIRRDSLNRTRETLIDYACMHESDWKSFITLTIADESIDIDAANKYFQNFVRQWRRAYPELIYLGVPEFQKRGAIHYHILTNVPCGSDLIPEKPIKNIWSTKYKKFYDLNFYDLKYWDSEKIGFSSAFDFELTDDHFNVALYITKYLYKDVDNRLFGRNKILKSNNLKKPDIVKLSHTSACYINAIEYIKEKGYDLEITSVRADKPHVIPFDVVKTKLSRDDYIMVQAILKDDIPF